MKKKRKGKSALQLKMAKMETVRVGLDDVQLDNPEDQETLDKFKSNFDTDKVVCIKTYIPWRSYICVLM